MELYLLTFLIVFFLSLLFSMAGTGAGIAIIPILHFLGVPFNLAKPLGLFSGFITTSTSSVLNFKRGALQIKRLLPLALTLLVAAPLGAQLSRFVDVRVVKWLFVFFLIFSASMILFYKKEPKLHLQTPWILALAGSTVGLLSGLLGVGGGNILLPILIFLGFAPKETAIAVSFVVPFSALASFLSYLSFVQMDWMLLLCCGLGAVAGSSIGNHLMFFKLSAAQVKKLIAFILYLLALKMGYTLIKGAI